MHPPDPQNGGLKLKKNREGTNTRGKVVPPSSAVLLGNRRRRLKNLLSYYRNKRIGGRIEKVRKRLEGPIGTRGN